MVISYWWWRWRRSVPLGPREPLRRKFMCTTPHRLVPGEDYKNIDCGMLSPFQAVPEARDVAGCVPGRGVLLPFLLQALQQ